MRELTIVEIGAVSGGMDTSNGRLSNNVIDKRNPDYIDANNMCWAPGTPDSTMYPTYDADEGDGPDPANVGSSKKYR